MHLNVKIGDTILTIEERQMTGLQRPGTYGQHIVVLADAVSKATEVIVVESEVDACKFASDFLTPDGPPTGGIYDHLVTGSDFKP